MNWTGKCILFWVHIPYFPLLLLPPMPLQVYLWLFVKLYIISAIEISTKLFLQEFPWWFNFQVVMKLAIKKFRHGMTTPAAATVWRQSKFHFMCFRIFRLSINKRAQNINEPRMNLSADLNVLHQLFY